MKQVSHSQTTITPAPQKTALTPRSRRRNQVRYVAEAAIIAALYVVLTELANLLGLASMAIQVRFSEALCVLVMFTPAAVPGLWLGCFVANLLANGIIWDVVFGSLATLAGALGGRLLVILANRMAQSGKTRAEKMCHFLVPMPTVVANTIVVPLVLIYAYGLEGTLPFFMLTVGAGEVISAWILGFAFLPAFKRIPYLRNRRVRQAV